MNLNQIKIHKWTDKIHIPKKIGYSVSMGLAALILFLRLRPYFLEKVVVHPYTHDKGRQGEKSADGKKPTDNPMQFNKSN